MREEQRDSVCASVRNDIVSQASLQCWKYSKSCMTAVPLSGGEGLNKIVNKVQFSTKFSFITLILVFV